MEQNHLTFAIIVASNETLKKDRVAYSVAYVSTREGERASI